MIKQPDNRKMQEIPRALLLPPPSTPQRNYARGASGNQRDLPVEIERDARRAASADDSFLTLIDTRREDSVEFSLEARGGKQFRFRPYTNRATDDSTNAIERRAAQELAAPEDADPNDDEGGAARDVLLGFASGDGSRNSSAFLASFIAQEQLTDGLYNPPYGGASDAYRRAGGSPPVTEDTPRIVSFAA